uniref:G patch domain-containing protein 4 n=1 Tax=Gasterosteus aculeatus aculeatus TaxID=481459 RepID=A0AAQ4S0W5_GASAC|nr:G patch domain-containing protein 4 [Gasterosteus aculeatus aculeatus]
MAEVVPEKSRGLKFAEQQLLRHGWEYGKGLGRGENGLPEAIKVKVKCDKGGVGHKEGDQFTFHWWDHVFNKASSSLQVQSDQNGIQLTKTAEEGEGDGVISNKKPRKAALAKAKLYGCFVKSATLLSGTEQPDPKPSCSDSSSSDDEDDQKLDLSSTTKLSDADLMKACGGRTAHKGARHGLTMNAKLARLEQQEAEFMAKYGKKSRPANAAPVCVTQTPPTGRSADQRAERREETLSDSQRKKMEDIRSTGSDNELNELPVSPDVDVKPKKKKKKKKANEGAEQISDAASSDGDVIYVENGDSDHSRKTKRKHKKKKHNTQQDEEERTLSPAAASQEEPAELLTKGGKKKKRRESSRSEPDETNNAESQPVCTPKSQKTEEDTTVRHKRKKCKKDKSYADEDTNEETLCPKKSKKKSKVV